LSIRDILSVKKFYLAVSSIFDKKNSLGELASASGIYNRLSTSARSLAIAGYLLLP